MEVVGVIAGVLTLSTYVPQAYKTVITRKTRDLSLLTLMLLNVSALLWVVYGLVGGLPAIWVTNAVVFGLGLIILVIKAQNRFR